MKLSLVQILVVVANIQVTILKIEVEKGFMRTAVDHELVDPETQINLVNDLLVTQKIQCRKGKRLIFLYQKRLRGNTYLEIRDASVNIGESYLFLLTKYIAF